MCALWDCGRDANNCVLFQSKSQATIEELQSNLQKREADCLRLRESRDSINAEASVRRARDAERTNAVAQLKVLVETRGVRIA
jgi:septal ring factor EnvC (AmiA/AmiB activator)